MFLETNGKNTGSKYRMQKSLIASVLLTLFLLSCGDNEKTPDKTDVITQNPATPEGKEKLFEDIVNESIQRLKYRDRSFHYEMEFPYYRDEHTYDDYLASAGVPYSQVDTMEFVDILSLESFEPDSIVALINSHFKGPRGLETVVKGGKLTFYWHDGRWVKPTFSSYTEQHQNDEIRRQADSAARAEEKLGND